MLYAGFFLFFFFDDSAVSDGGISESYTSCIPEYIDFHLHPIAIIYSIKYSFICRRHCRFPSKLRQGKKRSRQKLTWCEITMHIHMHIHIHIHMHIHTLCTHTDIPNIKGIRTCEGSLWKPPFNKYSDKSGYNVSEFDTNPEQLRREDIRDERKLHFWKIFSAYVFINPFYISIHWKQVNTILLYLRYVNDTFMIWKATKEELRVLFENLNSKH